jgi:hypothetical protein
MRRKITDFFGRDKLKIGISCIFSSNCNDAASKNISVSRIDRKSIFIKFRAKETEWGKEFLHEFLMKFPATSNWVSSIIL